MDNDRKVKKDVVNQSRKIFLNWKNLEIGNKNLYDLEKEFSATKKNKNYLVIITILIFLIVFVGTAYAVTRYIQESGRIVPIEIKDFEDVNLKDILDVAKNYEQKLVRARNELKTLEAEHKNAVSEVRSQRERETQIVMESQNSEEEKRKSVAVLRRKESRTAAALDSEYGKKIEEKEKEISEIEKAIASYDATVVEQARKQEEILNNQQKMAELEMENTVGMYEERISDIEKRRDNEISSLKKDNRRLVSVLKSRHKKELDDMYKKYNPVFENEKYLKILSDKRAPSRPEYAADESVIILDKNNIISAAEIRMARKDASDIETILERLKGIEYENSVPQAFDRLFERGSSIISRYEKSWEKSADSVKSRNEQITSFSSAFDFYISETGVSGYILFIESSDRISVYMNRILEIAEGDKGYVFRSDSEMIGEIEFYYDNERILAKLINSDSGKETEDAVEIKPFDRILVQVE